MLECPKASNEARRLIIIIIIIIIINTLLLFELSIKIHKNSYDWMHLVRMAVALALTRCKFSLLSSSNVIADFSLQV